MYKIILIIILSLIFCLGFASLALAWGPGVHMAISNSILARPWLIPPDVAAILGSHQDWFRYGSLSPDIFIGKGSKAKKSHSHNWQTGFRLMEKAGDEALTAYALGYLSHLAADVVAHNYYVPNLLSQAPNGGKLSHVYIEMLADDQVNWSAKETKALFKLAVSSADKNLRASMDSRRLSFLLKKRVFHRSIGLLEYRSVNASLNFSRKMIPAFQIDYLRDMLNLSFRSVVDLINSPDSAKALKFDPIGSLNLGTAGVENKIRNSLRRRKKDFSVRFDVDSTLFTLPFIEGAEKLLKIDLDHHPQKHEL